MQASLMAQPIQGNLLGQWDDPNIPGSSSYDNAYNEVWGLAVNGEEYAILGSTLGTHFINVTDPTNPMEDYFIEGAVSSDKVVHRDYHDHNGYLYAVCDEDYGSQQSTLQIIDISNLPESIEVIYDSNDLIRKSHNIYIDTATSRLYALAAAGGDWPYAAAKMYDISDPFNPTQIEKYDEFQNIDIGHVHDGFILRDTAYLNCGNNGFAIVDFTDPHNEQVLSFLSPLDYPESGYNHSGWPTEDGNYYYMADETWGKAMKVIDISNKTAIENVTVFDAGSSSEFSIPHNLIVHCNYLYVSYYFDGLQVYDISDPESPERVLYYPTSAVPHTNNYKGAWGVYPFLPSGNILVSDMQEGLFVIEGLNDDCSISTSTTENKAASLNTKVFPNPTEGIINIELLTTNDKSKVQIELVDLMGRTLYSSFQNSADIISLQIEPGSEKLLILKLNYGKKLETHKIILE